MGPGPAPALPAYDLLVADESRTRFRDIGYAVVQLLRNCGDNLTRENIMQQASHLNMELPLLLPGIRLHTSPNDLRPIKQMRLVRFNGERYVLFSDVIESN